VPFRPDVAVRHRAPFLADRVLFSKEPILAQSGSVEFSFEQRHQLASDLYLTNLEESIVPVIGDQRLIGLSAVQPQEMPPAALRPRCRPIQHLRAGPTARGIAMDDQGMNIGGISLIPLTPKEGIFPEEAHDRHRRTFAVRHMEFAGSDLLRDPAIAERPRPLPDTAQRAIAGRSRG
jgi:hypothetical protein